MAQWFVFLNGKVEGPLTAEYISSTYTHEQETLIWGASQTGWLDFNEWSHYLNSSDLNSDFVENFQSGNRESDSPLQDNQSHSLMGGEEFLPSDEIGKAESLKDLSDDRDSISSLDSQELEPNDTGLSAIEVTTKKTSSSHDKTEFSTIKVTQKKPSHEVQAIEEKEEVIESLALKASSVEEGSNEDGATVIESLENLENSEENKESSASVEEGSNEDGATVIESLENLENSEENKESSASVEEGSNEDGATVIESLENLENSEENKESSASVEEGFSEIRDGATVIESLENLKNSEENKELLCFR